MMVNRDYGVGFFLGVFVSTLVAWCTAFVPALVGKADKMFWFMIVICLFVGADLLLEKYKYKPEEEAEAQK